MKRRFRRFGPALFALAAATALTALPARAAEFEKSVAVPKAGRANLGWTSGGCSVRGVSLRDYPNYPNADDIRKARHEDPSDTSWLWWDFHVENRGSGKCRISLTVEVYDRSGRVVKSGDKTDTVDDHKLDDNIRISTRMRTLDIVDSPRARIRGEIRPR
ncbi:MAG: hypothetical protein ABI914_05805 [Acidobacteriota bacterium]